MKFLNYLAIILLSASFGGCASVSKSPQSNDEHLLISIPKDYVTDYTTNNEAMLLTEFVPKGESSSNWTEMITSQTYLNLNGITPRQFAKTIKSRGRGVCPGIKSTIGEATVQNGYQTYTWKQVCGLNPNTNRVEATLLKAIAGNKRFYTIQKAWAFYPTEKETKFWKKYLEKVIVCDSHIPKRICPHNKARAGSIE